MIYDISTQLTKVVLISFIVSWTIDSTRNVFIFTCPTLLWSSCKLHVLASSIDNILVIFTTSLTRVLVSDFSYDIPTLSILKCKWRYHCGYILFALSPYLYILACFDRYSLISILAAHQSWSKRKFAERCILRATVLACILYLPVVILFQLQPTNRGFRYTYRPEIFTILRRIFYLVVYCILPSVCISLLYILVLISIWRQSLRNQSVLITDNDCRRHLYHQMIRMLFHQF
jgi:hypothetical protein